MSRSLGLDQTKIYGSTNFDTSKLAIGVPCAHICIFIGSRCNVNTKPIGKYDQPIVYAYRLLNKTNHNYITIEKKTFAMVYVLHKVRHFLLGNKFIFYVDHMSLVYTVNKP
jgi:hypothetical protein